MSPLLLPFLLLLVSQSHSLSREWVTPPPEELGFTGCQNAATLGTDYAGMVNTTKSGRTCQAWNSNKPYKQNTDIFKVMKNVVGNPCRNPSKSVVGLWCYTTDPKKKWEACDVPTCTTTGCQNSGTLGTDYVGMVNTTKSGRTCQAWNSNYPHKLKSYGKNIQGNPCRNPNKSKVGLWCQTTDPKVKWEVCDVPACTTTGCQNAATLGADYRGSVSTTKSGKTCQAWSSSTPHKLKSYAKNIQGNPCRNPNNYKGGLWCQTTDPKVSWELCDVPACTTGCQNATTKGTDYNGMVSTTKSGRTCQNWNSDYPHKPHAEVLSQVQNLHGNPCRNPNNSPAGLWCYTTDPEMRWEECDVPTCTTGVGGLTKKAKKHWLTKVTDAVHSGIKNTLNLLGRSAQGEAEAERP